MNKRVVRGVTVLLPSDQDEAERLERVPGDGERIDGALNTADAWASAEIADVTIRRSYLVNADLSLGRPRNVSFDRCVLRGSSLIGAHLLGGTFKDVIVENCRLDYVLLNHVRANGAMAIVGVASLEGAVVQHGQLSGLVEAVIAELDLIVKD